MKRFLLIACITLAILVLSVGLVWLRLRADKPERLIARLESAKGTERQDILLRLSLSRGDVIATLLHAFDRAAAPAFRAELLDLALKRNLREPDERVESLVRKALTDKAAEPRRAAAYGLVAYGNPKQQLALADAVRDADPPVRRHAYALFASGGYGPNNRGAFGLLPAEQLTNLIAACVEKMKTETDPEMAFLARSVVGREITIRCEEAAQALLSADVSKAKALIEGALVLDPENQQAQVRLARLYLATGDSTAAVAAARQYAALIETPRLSKAPVIDGDPSDEVWREGYTTERFYHTTSTYVAKPTTGKSRCHVGHRDGMIYVAMLGFEDDLDQLVVKHKDRDGDIWFDDCVELIFSPDCSEKDFIQFIINPAGTVMDQRSGDKTANFKCEHKAGVFKERGYWAVEFAIEAKELTPTPVTTGTVWAVNFFRARIGAASEHSCIWPMYGYALRPGLYPLAIFKDAPGRGD